MHVIFQILILGTLYLTTHAYRFQLDLGAVDSSGVSPDSATCNIYQQTDFFMSNDTKIFNCTNGICEIEKANLTTLLFRSKKTQLKQSYELKSVYITNATFIINASCEIVMEFAKDNLEVWVITPISYNQKQLSTNKFVIDVQQIKPYPNNEKYSEGRLFPEFINFITSGNTTTMTTFNFLNSLDFGHFFHAYIDTNNQTITYLISQKLYRIRNLNNRTNLSSLQGANQALISFSQLSGWDRICYGARLASGFMMVNFQHTYTVWVSWFSVLVYSIYVVFPRFSSQQHCYDKRFFKNPNTCCALYSLFYLQSPIFYTRLSRSVMLMLNSSVHCLVVSLIFKYYVYTSAYSIVIWSATIAFACSIPFPYFLGYFFLHQIDKLSLKKYQLMHQEKENYKKTHREIYYDLIQTSHQKIQALYFWYYVIVAYLYMICWALAIYFAGHYQQQDMKRVHEMWTLSVFLAFIIDWLIYDPLMTFFFGKYHFYQIRGFYYQYQIGQLYRLSIKN